MASSARQDAVVAKYLERHAEPEAGRVQRLPGSWQHVLVVPALAEDPARLRALVASLSPESLAIVVVNASDEHDQGIHRTNQAVLEELSSGAARVAEGWWAGETESRGWLVLDRASPGRRIPRREGVGLARKIGCDLALALAAEGRVQSRWIHTSDGDVSLPADYFERSAAAPAAAALLAYPFVHVGCGEASLDRAHALYEVFLRYYALGLAWSGSPYALHTIGSTLAVDAHAYAAVRGFPKREAAEDFYLVNKLLKQGAAHVPAGEPIRIHARRSERVPFGTGRATATMLDAGLERGAAYAIYHPEIFGLLRAWLEALRRTADEGPQALEPALESSLEAPARAALDRAANELDLRRGLARALRGAPAASRRRRAHEWFDAFRTRKLVHALRDGALANLRWDEALARAPFVASSFGEPEQARSRLAALELSRSPASWPPR